MQAALFVLAALSPGQVIDGVRPIPDAGPKFAQAFAKRFTDDPAIANTPDHFVVGYFAMKAKFMAPLRHTKYTAAVMGISGTILNIFDPNLGAAIKNPSDRIAKGSLDFDSLTKAEIDAIGAAIAKEDGVAYPFNEKWTVAQRWRFGAGMSLASINAYATVWHMSPKEKTLLDWIGSSVKGCIARGAEKDASDAAIAAALKGFARFEGKTYDDATMREIGLAVESTLKAATPEKYRW